MPVDVFHCPNRWNFSLPSVANSSIQRIYGSRAELRQANRRSAIQGVKYIAIGRHNVMKHVESSLPFSSNSPRVLKVENWNLCALHSFSTSFSLASMSRSFTAEMHTSCTAPKLYLNLTDDQLTFQRAALCGRSELRPSSVRPKDMGGLGRMRNPDITENVTETISIWFCNIFLYY